MYHKWTQFRVDIKWKKPGEITTIDITFFPNYAIVKFLRAYKSFPGHYKRSYTHINNNRVKKLLFWNMVNKENDGIKLNFGTLFLK